MHALVTCNFDKKGTWNFLFEELITLVAHVSHKVIAYRILSKYLVLFWIGNEKQFEFWSKLIRQWWKNEMSKCLCVISCFKYHQKFEYWVNRSTFFQFFLKKEFMIKLKQLLNYKTIRACWTLIRTHEISKNTYFGPFFDKLQWLSTDAVLLTINVEFILPTRSCSNKLYSKQQEFYISNAAHAELDFTWKHF